MKKWASKVAHNQPKPFYFTVQPRPTAHSPELIFHIVKSWDQTSVLLSVGITCVSLGTLIMYVILLGISQFPFKKVLIFLCPFVTWCKHLQFLMNLVKRLFILLQVEEIIHKREQVLMKKQYIVN